MRTESAPRAAPPQHRGERVSYVIGALGVPDEYAPGTVRMTLSGETTREEIDRAVEALKQNLRKLRDEK